jgi:hypothetical protein
VAAKTAICTVTIGREYAALAEVTHPSLRHYARRIGADFVVFAERTLPATIPAAYEKLRAGELLGTYDRVLCIDSDIIVRPDAPSLFDVVAPADFGVLNEAPWFYADSPGTIARVCRKLGVPIPDFDWEHRHFQTGVLVLSRAHAPLFARPKVYFLDHPWEQPYLNLLLAAGRVPIHELPYRYNRVGCMDHRLAEARTESYLIHYAGTATGSPYGYGHSLRPGETFLDLVRRDLAQWDG